MGMNTSDKDAIIESLKSYITEFENLPYGMIVVKNDPFSTIIYANPIYYKTIGYTKEEMLEKYQNRISEILIDNVYNIVEQDSSQIEDYDKTLDLRLRTGMGEIIWGHSAVHYDAKLDVFFATVTDVTDKMVDSMVDLSFEAFQARNSVLAYVSQYSSECVMVSDIETDEMIYMNPASMELAQLNIESEWQGKTFLDIAFGNKENAHAQYFEPLSDKFTGREYYNEFHNIHVYAKNKLITIPNLNKQYRLTIVKDITAQKNLEQKILTRDTLNSCVETLFETVTSNNSSETVYYDMLKQLSVYYNAEEAFFYKFSNKARQIENVYRVLNNEIEMPDLALPITINEEQAKLLQAVANCSFEQSVNSQHVFGNLLNSTLEQFKVCCKFKNFSCVAVNDSAGEIVAFMGVRNLTENTSSKELLELLSRFVIMFIEQQKSKKIAEESIMLENLSRAKIVEKCGKNFQDVKYVKENIVDALESLSAHYDADFAMILYRNKDSDTYGIPYVGGSAITDLSTFQNQPSYAMDKWAETFSKHPHYVTDNELNSPTAKMILKNQFGIYNFIAAPLRGEGGELIGLLAINNYKLMNRSHLLAHGVAKSIYDYMEKVRREEQIQISPSAIATNKVDVKNKVSEMLKNEVAGTLFIIDIDNFRHVNDTLGHHVGDVIIVELLESLTQIFRKTDVISRISGDKFLVFSPSLVLRDSIERKANKIVTRCYHHYNKDGNSVAVSVSVGICPVSDKYKLYQTLYDNAEYALYLAKRSGRNCYQVFSDVEYSKSYNTMNELMFLPNVVHAIKTALDTNSFVVHYQPLYHVPTGGYTHAEALVRMKKTDGSLIYPNDFIEVAENTGLVVEITYQILEQVCRDFRQLLNENPDTILKAIAINLPYLQFTDPCMESRFMKILNKYDIEPHQIKLEITERIIANDMDLILSKMSSLKAKGFEFELDDFGTDYSNLKMCVSLPIDVIKLDRSLLLAAIKSEKDCRFFKHIILGLHDSNRFTVMEGVETKEQLDWSTECNCEYIQGYYFSKPVDFDNFKKVLVE